MNQRSRSHALRRLLRGLVCLSALGSGAAAARAQGAGIVLPAFVDHHVHVFNVGWFLLQSQRPTPGQVTLVGARTESDAVQRVTLAAPGAAWVTGFGWNQEAWGTSVMPTGTALTAALPTTPVALARTDGHALWVNRAALIAAGLTRDTTGVLLERASEPVIARIPAPSDSDVVASWRLGASALAGRGVVRVYDAGVLALPGVAVLNTDFRRYVRLLAASDRAAPLPIAINLMIPAPSPYAEAALRMTAAQRRLSPNVRITHLKLFADGAFGSRGAALTHPYADDPHTHGVLRMTSREIAALTRRALDAGLDVATHAIGDLAVKEALDAYESVLRERPRTPRGRLRIEHFSYAREADFARAVRLGIALSVQSDFNSPRGTSPTFAEQRIGAEGAPRVYAWDRLDRMGALLVEGSDAFGALGAPLAGLHAGLTGINAIGERGDSPEVRARLLTLNTRWLAPGGRLEAPVDSVVLSADPRTVAVESLLSVRVLAVRRASAPPANAAGTAHPPPPRHRTPARTGAPNTPRAR